MIDIHTHILPGIDDGPRITEEAMEILRQAVRAGVRAVVATSHVLETPNKDIVNRIHSAILDLRHHAALAGIDIEIICGAEIFISPDLPQKIKTHTSLTINNGNKYILLELPIYEIQQFTEQTLFELQVRGITPIIAHPERYLKVQKNPELLFDLLEKGILTQLNAGSLMGKYGKKVKKTAKTLLARGLVHMIGSDVHLIPPNASYPLADGVNLAAEIIGKERAMEMVTTVPEQVINGAIIEQALPNHVGIKKKRFSKLLKLFG